MEKNNVSTIIAVVALLFAVVGVTIGFAAFSTSLNINSEGEVTPTNTGTFKILFSSNDQLVSGVVKTDDIEPTIYPASTTEEPISGDNATIDNSGVTPKLSNLSAHFSAPGQKVTYSLYLTNQSEFDGFLESIIYENVTTNSPVKCTALAGTTDTYVQEACKDITLSVKVGNESAVTGSQSGYTGHKLEMGNFEPVEVVIEYKAGAALVDGDFTVEFGKVAINYVTIQ